MFNRQYSENNTGKSVFEHGRKGGQNFNRTSTKQRPLNLKLKKKNCFRQNKQIILHSWRSLTSDQKILEIIAGLQIKFDVTPLEVRLQRCS